MRIAVAQMRVHAGRPAANYTAMLGFIKRAREQKTDILIFPEMCVPGYLIGDAWERTAFLKECESLGQKLASAAQDIILIFGNVGIDWQRKNEDGRVRKYNGAFVAQNGHFLVNPKTGYPFWPKTLLPNYREFDDSRHFFDLRKLALERNQNLADLLSPVTFTHNTQSYVIGLGVCEDGWPDDYSVSPMTLANAGEKPHFLVNISCSPFSIHKREKRQKNFSQLAQKAGAPILFSNSVGVQNNGKNVYGFDGSSGAFAKDGSLIYKAPFFTEDLAIFQWEPNSRSLSALAPSQDTTTHDETFEKQISLESIVRFCLDEWKISRVVIGVSGGIDSAVSATLFARILDPKNVYLVNMPSRFNSSLTQNAAKTLASNLGCPYGSVGIQNIVEETVAQLKTLSSEHGFAAMNVSSFVQENIQARDRGGRLLAGIAASLGAVYSCNSNKSEISVGFSTLYGDLTGFLAPIGDLWKHEIYALANYYNQHVYGREVIPPDIINVVPSPELSDAHDVTKGLGDPIIYPYHDYLFQSWVEHWDRKTPFDILQAYDNGKLEDLIGCEKGLVQKLFKSREDFVKDLERWWNLYHGLSSAKRVQAPPIVTISKRAFGFDHRENVMLPYYDEAFEELKKKK